MLFNIACVTIFSAIIVFFSEELGGYVKALVKRPYTFMFFSLLILSTVIELYANMTLMIVLEWWIWLLYVVQGLSYILGDFYEQLLAKLVLVVFLSVTPVAIALWQDERKRRHSLYNSDDIKKRGYSIGFFLWVSSVLLFALGVPGSDFSG
ncbi:MAG: hypothetical protein ACO1N3_03375 [Gammaproteobacteria bacterium]